MPPLNVQSIEFIKGNGEILTTEIIFSKATLVDTTKSWVKRVENIIYIANNIYK